MSERVIYARCSGCGAGYTAREFAQLPTPPRGGVQHDGFGGSFRVRNCLSCKSTFAEPEAPRGDEPQPPAPGVVVRRHRAHASGEALCSRCGARGPRHVDHVDRATGTLAARAVARALERGWLARADGPSLCPACAPPRHGVLVGVRVGGRWIAPGHGAGGMAS